MKLTHKIYLLAGVVAVAGAIDLLTYPKAKEPPPTAPPVVPPSDVPPCFGLPRMVVGFEPASPLLGVDNGSQPIGPSAEIVAAVLKKAGCQAAWRRLAAATAGSAAAGSDAVAGGVSGVAPSSVDLIVGSPQQIADLIGDGWRRSQPYAVVQLKVVNGAGFDPSNAVHGIVADDQWLTLIRERYPQATPAAPAAVVKTFVDSKTTYAAVLGQSGDDSAKGPNHTVRELLLPLEVALRSDHAAALQALDVALVSPAAADAVRVAAARHQLDDLKPP